MNPSYDKNQIRAIIGLGNPGDKYYKTRHNIGFRVVDALVEQFGGSWHESGKMTYVTLADLAPHPVYVIKPLTFMNNSGDVLPWLTKKGIKGDQLIVVHDELEKPFGSNLIKFSGSAKGHNGLRSIIGKIGQDFWRLRFGIGRPQGEISVGDFVLQPFSQQEESSLGALIQASCKLLLDN